MAIVKQEQNQYGNDPADLSEGRQESGGKSLPQMEKQGVPGGDR